jgi:hypothetical protein
LTLRSFLDAPCPRRQSITGKATFLDEVAPWHKQAVNKAAPCYRFERTDSPALIQLLAEQLIQSKTSIL